MMLHVVLWNFSHFSGVLMMYNMWIHVSCMYLGLRRSLETHIKKGIHVRTIVSGLHHWVLEDLEDLVRLWKSFWWFNRLMGRFSRLLCCLLVADCPQYDSFDWTSISVDWYEFQEILFLKRSISVNCFSLLSLLHPLFCLADLVNSAQHYYTA